MRKNTPRIYFCYNDKEKEIHAVQRYIHMVIPRTGDHVSFIYEYDEHSSVRISGQVSSVFWDYTYKTPRVYVFVKDYEID